MGEVCCSANIEGQMEPVDNLRLLITPVSKEEVNKQVEGGPHEPHESFAVPTKQQNRLSAKAIERAEELGTFYYQRGSSIPQGKILSSYKLQNGSIYAGEWKSGKIHGRGIYVLPNQTVIYSLTNQNHITGLTRVIYPNGDYFQGDVMNGKANGEGVYLQGDVRYQGEFKDNLPDGEGIQVGLDYKFDGTFELGQKTKGKLTWGPKDQFSFTGTFVNGKFEGKGTLVNADGKYVGQFKRGVKSGKGRFFYNNNRYFEGSFVGDVRNGEGVIVDEKEGKVILRGKWINDTLVDS